MRETLSPSLDPKHPFGEGNCDGTEMMVSFNFINVYAHKITEETSNAGGKGSEFVKGEIRSERDLRLETRRFMGFLAVKIIQSNMRRLHLFFVLLSPTA